MNSVFKYILSLFYLIVPLEEAHTQNRYYVNATATGANNGLTWQDAFSDLHKALQTAQSGDSVWVAQGIYKPTSDSNRDTFFFMQSGVRLLGGFAGNETEISQRDWSIHPTVLSGDIGVYGDSTDNSYNILVMAEAAEGTLLDGIVFCGGNAKPDFINGNEPYQRNACGAALYINALHAEAYPVVRHCRFERNFAFLYGGAVFIRAASDGSIGPQFLNCTFDGNNCLGDGGAVYCNGSVEIERIPDFGACTFTSNKSSRWGEAILYRGPATNDTLHIVDCHFNLNGDNLRGVVETWTDNHIRIDHCDVENNYAPFLINEGILTGPLSCYINACNFTHNKSGALSTSSYDTKITNCIFRHNQTTGLADYSRNFTISDCILDSNRWYSVIQPSSVCESCIFSNLIISNNEPDNPNGLWLFPGHEKKGWSFHNIQIVNNDSLRLDFFTANEFYKDTIAISHFNFIHNKFFRIPWFETYDYPATTIRNSLFFGNIYDPVDDFSQYLKLTFDNCAFDNLDCSQLPATVTCSNNLTGINPLFRDTANGDYTLLPCSPLINAGSNTAAAGIPTDLAGNPRIQGGTVDIGAYEAPAFTLAAEPLIHPACEGASNGSIFINPIFGCEPYTYTWSPTAGNGPELKDLMPGNYLLTLTDGSGRQILDTMMVAAAPSPVLNTLANDVQCGETLGGSIIANTSSGTAPFHFQWQPAAADTSKIFYLTPGLYALTVVDANGCQDSSQESIALRGGLTPMIDGKTISCFGAADGWLSLTPATGAAPFQWQWDGWPGTDSIAQPLGPGIYSATVTDVYGCTAANSFPPMTQPDSLWATVFAQDQTDLVMPNGTATVSAILGGSSPYGFEWSTGSTQQSIEGLTAGAYRVTVTDKNGCETQAEVVVDLMLNAAETAEAQAFIVYPNPATDWLKVVFPARAGAGGAYRIELSDLSGKVLMSMVKTASASGILMDIRDLPAGDYVVTARNSLSKGLFSVKITKH